MSERATDLFRPLRSAEVPDQWPEIERRLGRRVEGPAPRRPLRALALVAATLVGIVALIAYLVTAFRSTDPPMVPASPPPSLAPVGDVTLGPPIRLDVGIVPGGSLDAMVEASGSLWVLGTFGKGSDPSLQRIDPSDGTVQAWIRRPFDVEGGDGTLAVGGGYIWATSWKSATIYRIDQEDASVVPFHLDGEFEGDFVGGIAWDADAGTIWALLWNRGDPALVELDPADGTVLSSTPFLVDWAESPLPVRGTVWTLGRDVVDGTVQGGFLRRLLPGSIEDVHTGGSFALPATDGRWIWTPFSGDDTAMNLANTIAQVDPTDGSIVEIWPVRRVGHDIAVGSDGGIWIVGARGSLRRLNPSTGKVETWPTTMLPAASMSPVPTPLPTTPIFVVPTSDGIWVGMYEGWLQFHPFTNG